MINIIIDDDLHHLKNWVNEILSKCEQEQYLDTDHCLDLLNYAKKVLENVYRQPELPLEDL